MLPRYTKVINASNLIEAHSFTYYPLENMASLNLQNDKNVEIKLTETQNKALYSILVDLAKQQATTDKADMIEYENDKKEIVKETLTLTEAK